MLWVNDGHDTKSIPLLLNIALYGKQNCDIIILEGILNSSWYRNLFIELKKEFQKNIFAYYFDIPFEETLLRHNTKPNRFDFGENEMRRWWIEKDYTDIFQEITLNKELTSDDIVNIIYNDVIK